MKFKISTHIYWAKNNNIIFYLQGYGGYGRDPYARGGDPYARGGDPMYDRRQPYPPPGGHGGRAMGGSGPMRGPDPYAG